MTKKRIQVYADPETKRRVELAAARRNVPVTEYCLDAIRQRLDEEGVLEQAKIEIPVEPLDNQELLDKLRVLHQDILASRGGKLIDVDQVIDRVREEREHKIRRPGPGLG